MLYPFGDVLEDFSKVPDPDVEARARAQALKKQRQAAEHQAQQEHERMVALEQARLAQQARDIQAEQSKVFDAQRDVVEDALTKERYQQGYNEAAHYGKSQNKSERADLKAQYQRDFQELSQCFKDENARREEIVEKITHLFAQSVTALLKKLLKSPQASSFGSLQNDLCEDAAHLAKLAGGDVTLQCPQSAYERMKTLLQGEENIEIIPSSDNVDGKMEMFSKGRFVEIDPQKWQKKVIDMVLARIDRLMSHRQDTSPQSSHNNSNEGEHGG